MIAIFQVRRKKDDTNIGESVVQRIFFIPRTFRNLNLNVSYKKMITKNK